MKRELEALLFATESPLTLARLTKLFPGTKGAEIKEAIKGLDAEYRETGHAFSVVEFGGGWQIATLAEYAPIVEKMFKGRRFARLSKAGLEVLAIIAYRQPITRLEIDDIRGVQSSGALSTLSERNLITVVGRSEALGHPLLYGTTREFLNHLGLKGISQLPALPDLEQIIDKRDELKACASQCGEEILDSELDELQGGEDDADDTEPAAPDDPILDGAADPPEPIVDEVEGGTEVEGVDEETRGENDAAQQP